MVLLWPTLGALWVAAGGWPGWHLLAVFTLGTILMRSAGCCVNDVADRDFDRHVKRTALRPVTTGAVSVREALGVGAALAVLALALVLSTNALTVGLSVGALLITIAYPFAKRWVALPQAVLGLAFGMGIPMAFAAVQAQVTGQALALALANLAWVLAYDTEYAMVDRDDDLKIGIRTSAITLGRWDVAAVMGFYAAFLLGWSAALGGALVRTPAYLLALALACAQVGWHYTLIRGRSREGCFKAFRMNHWLGLTLLLGTAAALSGH